MSNTEYAAAMRREAEKWLDILPVTKEQWLRIADRIEVSQDPRGTEDFQGLDPIE